MSATNGMRRIWKSSHIQYPKIAFSFIPIAVVLLIVFFAREGITQTDAAPYVVSTIPANGVTDVSRDLNVISVTFSEPIQYGALLSSNWWPYTYELSADMKTFNIVRTSTDKLAPGSWVVLTFNSDDWPPETLLWRDMDGNPLPAYVVYFQIDFGTELLKVEANPAKGFYWPYYLSIPNSLSKNTVLLVEPNNTGTSSDTPEIHEVSALELIRRNSWLAVDMDVPYLVPTFPRPLTPPAPKAGGIYTHALDRYSLYLSYLPENLDRIDLQLIAMINDAKEKLTARGHTMDKKVFLTGFSASGAFVSRFTALHPDLVKAVAQGSPGGWPIAPVSQWNGITLRYPVGVADLEQLVGSPLNLNLFRAVPKYIYVGDQDTNDALDTRDMPQEDRDQICALLNCSPNPILAERWPIAQQMYASVGAEAQFVIYPGVAHGYSSQIWSDIKNFFNQHKITSPPSSPSSLTAKATSSSSIVLTWKDNSKDKTGFKIQRKEGACDSANAWSLIATKGADVTSHTNSGLTPNTTYAYRVRAYNGDGDSSYSNCASAKTALSGTPKSPTNLKATSLSASQIKLTWKDNSTDETSFKVYKKVGSGSWESLITKTKDAVSHTDSTAAGNTTTMTYSYYIQACNANGCSSKTNTVIVPFKPANLSANALSSTKIKITWTDNSSNETGFEIERKSGSCSSANSWSKITTAGKNATTYSNTGLFSGETYSYRVRAYIKSSSQPYAYGYSLYPNCKSATTP
jgi:dienelactone hydrolase